jgi:hypothetical protein
MSNLMSKETQDYIEIEKLRFEISALKDENQKYKQAYQGIKKMMQASINAFSALGLSYYHIFAYHKTIEEINALESEGDE